MSWYEASDFVCVAEGQCLEPASTHYGTATQGWQGCAGGPGWEGARTFILPTNSTWVIRIPVSKTKTTLPDPSEAGAAHEYGKVTRNTLGTLGVGTEHD